MATNSLTPTQSFCWSVSVISPGKPTPGGLLERGLWIALGGLIHVLQLNVRSARLWLLRIWSALFYW
jgi:hypothetical protein